MSRMIAAFVLLVLMLSTNAQAYGILPDPTPEPEPTVEPSPTAEPSPEPTPEPTVVPDPTPPPTDESIPIPESIIRKALKPRAASLNLASATEQEKLDMLESNMDSIAVSLAFVQKAKGYDISGVLGLIAQIRENIDALITEQLDALVTATGDIDNEIVMAIFGGTITQQDIDRMAVQLDVIVNPSIAPELTPEKQNMYEYGVMGGVIVGVLLALIWAVTLKI